jgi:hypothetical protein
VTLPSTDFSRKVRACGCQLVESVCVSVPNNDLELSRPARSSIARVAAPLSWRLGGNHIRARFEYRARGIQQFHIWPALCVEVLSFSSIRAVVAG